MVAELFLGVVWLPLLSGLLVSFILEYFVQPGVAPPWRRPLPALALHCGLCLAVFTVELALFRRPWFATANVLFFLIVLICVNNAKVHCLREPFIAQDFEYFRDTIRYPRLYLPFFGIGKTLLATWVILLAIALGLSLEPAQTDTHPLSIFLGGIGFLIVLVAALLTWGVKARLPIVFDPEQDIALLGFLGNLIPYAMAERSCPTLTSPYARHRNRCLSCPPTPLPHLVVVQSESFFDPRPWCPSIRRDLLPNLDALQAVARLHGKLEVPAWGANTVRTEFAFLTGIPSDSLGVHRFNPYRKLAHLPPYTLVRLLQEIGYRTLCIHPYPAGFYGRSRIFPGFGFDQFIDIRGFDDQDKSGPYIGDQALADKICAALAASCSQPLLIFAISMENHGPLHWEQALPEETKAYYSTPPLVGCADLTIYLRHLRNADRMMGTLTQCLRIVERPSWLCWLGDHVPIMPNVYSYFGFPDGCTDYLLWSNQGSEAGGSRQHLQVEELGMHLLREAGFIPDWMATSTEESWKGKELT